MKENSTSKLHYHNDNYITGIVNTYLAEKLVIENIEKRIQQKSAEYIATEFYNVKDELQSVKPLVDKYLDNSITSEEFQSLERKLQDISDKTHSINERLDKLNERGVDTLGREMVSEYHSRYTEFSSPVSRIKNSQKYNSRLEYTKNKKSVSKINHELYFNNNFDKKKKTPGIKNNQTDENNTASIFNKRNNKFKSDSKVNASDYNVEKLSVGYTRYSKVNNGKNSLAKIRGGSISLTEDNTGNKAITIKKSSIQKKPTFNIKAIVISKAFSLFKNKENKESESSSSVFLIAGLISSFGAMFGLIGFILIVSFLGLAGGEAADEEDNNSSSMSSYATSEEILLWDTLMAHFDDNETAVLGIMCNIKEESSFIPNNLQDCNNRNWGISDEEYTEKINDGTISKDDFLKSTYNGQTTGYNNNYGWVNQDGGYGFCQYTDYTKKTELYNYAVEWFDTGVGEGQAFDIGNAEMQANFICYMLDNSYSHLDTQLREATSVEAATYIWTSGYEKPKGDWKTIADDRAESADEIRAACVNGYTYTGSSYTSVSEEELSAEHIHYNQYDSRWGDLPYYYSDGGSNTITQSGCGPTSLAMVVTELTRDTDNPIVLTPDAACDFSATHGCHMKGGTAHRLFYDNSLLEYYGLNGENIGPNEDLMKEYLNDGCLLIITVGKGVYTGNGHCMVICEYDETGFLINDPNYSDSKMYRVNYAYLSSQGNLQQVFALWSIN